MAYREKVETEGREFDIDDRFVGVDELMSEERRPRRWIDERKDAAIVGGAFVDGVVGNNRGRAYRRGLPSTLTRDEWYLWRKAFEKCCAYCGDKQTNPILEHVVPIDADGGTTIYNVLPACQSCNTKKGTMDPFRWLSIIGWEPFLARLIEATRRMTERMR